MSAASFLGIAGMIAFKGYDGFMYSVGFLVAYLTVLLIVAEPLRNAGKYTMADVLAYRLSPRPVRALASLSTLTVSTFYMIAQMVGAGALVKLLLPGVSYEVAVAGVGVLMIVYVVFGGMLATTWVQIIKAVLLMCGTLFLSVLVLKHFNFDISKFFDAISHVPVKSADGTVVTKDFLQPGLVYGAKVNPWGPLDLISLGLALIGGTAGLPHILIRFYTVPDAKTARVSVVWAMLIIGAFYIMTTFLGFGAATILTPENIVVGGKPTDNMAAPLLAHFLGGEVFFAFISAVAFATILAVVAGLTISASTSFAHDFYSNVLHHGKETKPGEEVLVARITAFVVGAIAIFLAIKLQTVNVAFLVGLAFAVAASANLPVIVLSIFWRRFNTAGAVTGSPSALSPASCSLSSAKRDVARRQGTYQRRSALPAEKPRHREHPARFLAAILATLCTREPAAEARFTEMEVRANTGLGAEKAVSH